MSDVLIASVMGCMATLTAPLIAIAIKNWNSQKSLFRMSKVRKRSITGLWNGQLRYTDNSTYKGLEIDIEAKVHTSQKRIKGELSYIDSMTKERTLFAVNGGFYNDSFLMLSYENSDKKHIQFGSAILELSPNPVSLNGLFQGFGRETKAIISGSISLQKVK